MASKFLSDRRSVLYTLVLTSFVMPMSMSSLNVALPAISAELGASAVQTSWVVMAFAFILATAMFPAAWLADRIGRKRVFLSGLILAGIILLLSSMVTDIRMLIALRLLQGGSAAMIFATSNAIIVSIFPVGKRGAVMGLTSGAVYLGITLGPVLGGYITAWFSWREVFLLPLPFLCSALWLASDKLVLEPHVPSDAPFDWAGLFFFVCTLSLALFGASRFYEPVGWFAFMLSAASFVNFVKTESVKEKPLVNVGLFTSNRVFGMACLSMVLAYSSSFSVSFLLSFYLQYIAGYSPDTAGLMLVVTAACMVVVTPFAGRLSDKYPPRWLASSGLTLNAMGLFLLARLDGGQSISHIVTAQVLIGIGFGLFSAPNSNRIMSSVSTQYVGQASASIPTMRGIGNLTSMSIVTGIFAAYLGSAMITPENTGALMNGISLSFSIISVLAVLGAATSMIRVHKASDTAS
ncbi:MAG: MFS transporter [Proteobacteria bacterium]|jgi:EmrB/QacA subfamily drug resistance transporter|nr:MFS transporter [Pseudomonadota bacterium]